MKIRLAASFCAVAGLSIGLLTWVDRSLFDWLHRNYRTFEIIPDLRLPSLLLCALLFAMTDPKGAHHPPRNIPWRKLSLIFLAWLLPAAFCVLVVRVWVPSLPRPEDIATFMVTGLVAEELLFRGAVYQTAGTLWGHLLAWRLPVPVIVSAVLFGLSHFQYHSFEMNAASLMQVGYTTVMGVFLALPRSLTGSLWPCVLLHALNNGLTLLR